MAVLSHCHTRDLANVEKFKNFNIGHGRDPRYVGTFLKDGILTQYFFVGELCWVSKRKFHLNLEEDQILPRFHRAVVD